MKRFYVEYSTEDFWRQAVAKLPRAEWNSAAHADFLETLRLLIAEVPWGQHLHILNKPDDAVARLYYLQATAQFGWSRSVLLNQIKARAYQRAKLEKKTHNFALALPEHLAEQAQEMIKSSYSLEFLGIARATKERELEDRLIDQLRDFILELGYGFCFVGRSIGWRSGKKLTLTDSRCSNLMVFCVLRRRRCTTKPRVAALRRAPWGCAEMSDFTPKGLHTVMNILV